MNAFKLIFNMVGFLMLGTITVSVVYIALWFSTFLATPEGLQSSRFLRRLASQRVRLEIASTDAKILTRYLHPNLLMVATQKRSFSKNVRLKNLSTTQCIV